MEPQSELGPQVLLIGAAARVITKGLAPQRQTKEEGDVGRAAAREREVRHGAAAPVQVNARNENFISQITGGCARKKYEHVVHVM